MKENDDFEDFVVRAEILNRSEKPVDRDVSRARRPWRDYRLLCTASCSVKVKKQVEAKFGVLCGAHEPLQRMSSMIVERNTQLAQRGWKKVV